MVREKNRTSANTRAAKTELLTREMSSSNAPVCLLLRRGRAEPEQIAILSAVRKIKTGRYLFRSANLHVERLHYRICSNEGISYENPPPIKPLQYYRYVRV